MISFKSSSIVSLLESALAFEALDSFADSVLDELAGSEAFSTEQKLATRIVTDSLVRSNMGVQAILEYVANGDWTTGNVSVSALTEEQRGGIIMAIVANAQAILTAKAIELNAMADAIYSIPDPEAE